MVLCKRERRRWKEMISFVFCLWSFFDEYKGQKRRRWQRNYFVLNVAIQPRNRRNRRRKQNNDDDGSLPIPLVPYHPSSFYTVTTYPHTKIQLYWMDLKNSFPPSFSSPLFLSSHVLSCSLFYSPVSSSPVISSMFSSPHISSGLEDRRGEERRGEERRTEENRGQERTGREGMRKRKWIFEISYNWIFEIDTIPLFSPTATKKMLGGIF